MPEIKFSAISDDVEGMQSFVHILEEFKKSSGVTTSVMRLTWERAWQSLLVHAIEAKGADVSQVGSTWAPTLAALDSLRPFTEAEVNSFGGPLAYVPAAWQTVRIEGQGSVWAIPLTVYTFVIFYRRDLLKHAGVDESLAFSSPTAMHETFKALHAAQIVPFCIPTKSNYLDMPHIVSSWVRAYGGEFISPDGRRVLFNTPHAREGLTKFFELLRYIPRDAHNADYDACLDLFFQGKTAAVIAGVESYSEAFEENSMAAEVRGQVGVAPVPGVAWIGGDHLVIWKTVLADPAKERAAVDLVRSFTSVANQSRIAHQPNNLPARLEAYPQVEFEPEGMKEVLENVLQTARPHPPVRLWRRIESMLVDMLCDIAHFVVEFQTQSVTEIVEAKLNDYEQRYKSILGG